LKKEFPEVYYSGLVHSSKAGSLEMLKHSENYLLLGQVFGKTFSTPIAYCGQGMTSSTANTVAMCDLNFDPEDIINLTEYELREDAIGKSGSPIKLVQINKTVPVLPAGSMKDPDTLFDISHSELCKRAKVIRSDSSFHERVSNVLSGRTYKKRIPQSPEEAIYDSFTGREDVLYAEGFSLANNCQRWGMVNNFQDPRWREFSKRRLVSQDFDNAPDVAKSWYLNLIDKRLHSKGYGMTNEEALNQTIDLLEDASGEDRKILMTLKSFLEGRML
jgi:exonuclease I